MPDLVIRNMKKPKNCNSCKLRYGLLCLPLNLSIGMRSQRISTGRLPECPLGAELPDGHGDMADVDAYREEFMSGVYSLCSDDTDNIRANSIIDLYDNIHIDIPADRPEGKDEPNDQNNL